MNNSINKELTQAIIDRVSDFEGTDIDELHYNLFNTDYYIYGTYQANQWLESHGETGFDAIAYVIEKELEQFGESYLKPEDINAENIVNLVVYFASRDLFPYIDNESGLVDADYIEALNSELEK